MIIFSAGHSTAKFISRKYKSTHYYVDQLHEGDNIDFLNPWYCELTALYYLYKHHENDNIFGLDQYRKAFNLDETQINDKLLKYDILVHYTKIEQLNRMYFLNRGWGYGSLSAETKKIYAVIKSLDAKCAECFIEALNAKSSCQHNMFICNSKIFNLYCNWLFSILQRYTLMYDIRTAPKRCVGHIIELTGLNTFINYYKLNAYNAEIIIGRLEDLCHTHTVS